MSTSEILLCAAAAGIPLFVCLRLGLFGRTKYVIGPYDRVISIQNMIVAERVVFLFDGEKKSTSFWSFMPSEPINTRD